LSAVQVLIDDRIRPNLACDLLLVPPVAISSARVGMSMPYTFGNRTGGAADAKKHLAGARFARHLHDFAAGRSPHDRVVHDQDVLVLEFEADDAQLLAYHFLRMA